MYTWVIITMYIQGTQVKMVVDSTLNEISNWSLLKLIISDQAPITLKYFLPINVQFNGQKFSCFSEKLSFNPLLFG